MELRVPSDHKLSTCIIDITDRSQTGVWDMIGTYEGCTPRHREPLSNPIDQTRCKPRDERGENLNWTGESTKTNVALRALGCRSPYISGWGDLQMNPSTVIKVISKVPHWALLSSKTVWASDRSKVLSYWSGLAPEQPSQRWWIVHGLG
jgi:hypothetical protein